MMVRIYLYGEQHQYGDQPRADRDTVVTLSITSDITVAQVLADLGIAPEEVAHIFLNRKLLKAGSTMAPWLGYQTETDRLPGGPPIRGSSAEFLDACIRSGDRLGLFPRRMAMLVV